MRRLPDAPSYDKIEKPEVILIMLPHDTYNKIKYARQNLDVLHTFYLKVILGSYGKQDLTFVQNLKFKG